MVQDQFPQFPLQQFCEGLQTLVPSSVPPLVPGLLCIK